MGYPVTSDGKQIHLVNMFPGDVNVNYTGVGDDIANGSRFNGTLFQIASTIQELKTLEWQFMEWVYLAGGYMLHKGAVLGDWIAYEVSAPATVGTEGGGAYAKQQVAAGLNRFIAQEGGGWVLNLTEKLNANVGFTKVVPVPNETGVGQFNWDEDTGAVTPATDGKGAFDLFDQQLTLSKFITKAPIMGDGTVDMIVPAVKPKKILPHWKHKLTLNNSSAKTLDMAWMLYLARRKTA